MVYTIITIILAVLKSPNNRKKNNSWKSTYITKNIKNARICLSLKRPGKPSKIFMLQNLDWNLRLKRVFADIVANNGVDIKW